MVFIGFPSDKKCDKKFWAQTKSIYIQLRLDTCVSIFDLPRTCILILFVCTVWAQSDIWSGWGAVCTKVTQRQACPDLCPTAGTRGVTSSKKLQSDMHVCDWGLSPVVDKELVFRSSRNTLDYMSSWRKPAIWNGGKSSFENLYVPVNHIVIASDPKHVKIGEIILGYVFLGLILKTVIYSTYVT